MEATIRRQLGIFFGVTLLVSWLIWLPAVLQGQGMAIPVPFLILSMFASFIPSIVGLVGLGKESKTSLWQSLKVKMRPGGGLVPWLLGLVLVPIIGLLSYILVSRLDPGFPGQINGDPLAVVITFLVILVMGGALGEEMGWRGYALPKLQDLYSPLVASLVLGVIWSLWHAPLFFMEGTVQSNIPWWQFGLQNTLMAFYYTWLYNRSKGNLTLMIVFHAVANTTAAIFPYWQTDLGRWIGFGLLALPVLLALLRGDFSRDRAYK